MTIKQFTVSIHIPKTAGTSVAEVFSRTLQKRIIFDYDGYQNPTKCSDEIVENKNFIASYFRVLHGHFYASKYFDVFPDAQFVATLRHPVERVISQYLHELNESSPDAMYHSVIQSGKMDIVQFAEEPGVGDAFAKHLSGRAICKYSLLLISEKLLESLAIYSATIQPLHLQQHYGRPIKLPRENQGSARSNAIYFDDVIRKEIYFRTNEDNAIYAEAMSLLNEKIRKIL